MGFLDVFRGKKALRAPSPDRLFAITTAGVTLETAHDIRTAGKAAIVFQPLSAADFATVAADMEELVRSAATETGTTVDRKDDSYGYRWIVLSDPDLDDLAVSVNTVNSELSAGGYGDRVLCALFAFKDAAGKPVHFVYNVKRGSWYPFVPVGGEARDSERELRLQAILARELPLEADLSRWFPLWGAPV